MLDQLFGYSSMYYAVHSTLQFQIYNASLWKNKTAKCSRQLKDSKHMNKNPSKYTYLTHINMWVYSWKHVTCVNMLCNVTRLKCSPSQDIGSYHADMRNHKVGIYLGWKCGECSISPLFWLLWLQRGNALGGTCRQGTDGSHLGIMISFSRVLTVDVSSNLQGFCLVFISCQLIVPFLWFWNWIVHFPFACQTPWNASGFSLLRNLGVWTCFFLKKHMLLRSVNVHLVVWRLWKYCPQTPPKHLRNGKVSLSRKDCGKNHFNWSPTGSDKKSSWSHMPFLTKSG